MRVRVSLVGRGRGGVRCVFTLWPRMPGACKTSPLLVESRVGELAVDCCGAQRKLAVERVYAL